MDFLGCIYGFLSFLALKCLFFVISGFWVVGIYGFLIESWNLWICVCGCLGIRSNNDGLEGERGFVETQLIESMKSREGLVEF